MTQIRVHELASELNVSTQQILSFVEGLGRKVRGPSTVLGVSVAAKVRGRFRSHRSVVVGQPAVSNAVSVAAAAPSVEVAAALPVAAPPVVHSLFLPPVPPTTRPVAAGAAGGYVDPFAVPAAADQVQAAPRLPAPAHRTVVDRLTHIPPAVPIAAEEPDHEAVWDQRGINEQDREAWVAAGLRLTEADLADRCLSADITPAELTMKLSGRTTLQRLRDGEASTSVWARIREAEQQPRRAGTKLTGRFGPS